MLTSEARYFKMADVPYSILIPAQYVSKEYPKIKFYFLKKQLSDTFQIHQEYTRIGVG